MKNNLMLKFILLTLLIQLGSCKKDKVALSYMPSFVQKVEPDTIINLKKRSLLFLKKTHPLLFQNNVEVVYYQEKDIDLDGQTEILLAFGFKDSVTIKRVTGFVLLRNEPKGIAEIVKDYDFSFKRHYYHMNDIRLISLQ
jgi:hypothetical protein